ncbi:hypothetical protein [Thermaurantiacus tibetensis]|uniref:hypothetical protein n=1 Tax=Thermaurantiacus tibetensis TaxID=2759035 RepID=UPI00188E5E8D|nr:hypothetical protein [Thermaurantiacus tibetensis]
MTTATEPFDPAALAARCRLLVGVLHLHAGPPAPPSPLEAEVAEAVARNFGRRRADRPGRDNRIYRLGQAFETLDAIDLEDYALLGLLGGGPTVLAWLLEATEARLIGEHAPGLLDILRDVLAVPERRRFAIEMGAYLRWHHEKTVRDLAAADWQASPAANDPHAPWRRRPPTSRQRYAIASIVRTLSAVDPEFRPPAIATRGEAHDFLERAGGNPRFRAPPAPPRPPKETRP